MHHAVRNVQVILDPAAVIKELLENALDARSSRIEIALTGKAALTSISVSDNGSGIAADDLHSTCMSNATSKIQTFEDVSAAASFGFRGQALAGVCAIAGVVEINTRREGDDCGMAARYNEKGEMVEKRMMARNVGTTIIVRDLFAALPVRKRNMERNAAKGIAKCLRVVEGIALMCTTVRIDVTVNGELRFMSRAETGDPGFKSNAGGESFRVNLVELKKVVSNILGRRVVAGLEEVSVDNLNKFVHTGNDDLETAVRRREGLDAVRVREHARRTGSLPTFGCCGFVSRASLDALGRGGRAKSTHQYIYANGRPVDCQRLTKSMSDLYRKVTGMTGASPVIILNLTLPNGTYDINTSPSKRMLHLPDEWLLLHGMVGYLETLWAPKSVSHIPKKLTTMDMFFNSSKSPGKESKKSNVDINRESQDNVEIPNAAQVDKSYGARNLEVPKEVEKGDVSQIRGENLTATPLSNGPALENGEAGFSQKEIDREDEDMRDVSNLREKIRKNSLKPSRASFADFVRRMAKEAHTNRDSAIKDIRAFERKTNGTPVFSSGKSKSVSQDDKDVNNESDLKGINTVGEWIGKGPISRSMPEILGKRTARKGKNTIKNASTKENDEIESSSEASADSDCPSDMQEDKEVALKNLTPQEEDIQEFVNTMDLEERDEDGGGNSLQGNHLQLNGDALQTNSSNIKHLKGSGEHSIASTDEDGDSDEDISLMDSYHARNRSRKPQKNDIDHGTNSSGKEEVGGTLTTALIQRKSGMHTEQDENPERGHFSKEDADVEEREAENDSQTMQDYTPAVRQNDEGNIALTLNYNWESILNEQLSGNAEEGNLEKGYEDEDDWCGDENTMMYANFQNASLARNVRGRKGMVSEEELRAAEDELDRNFDREWFLQMKIIGQFNRAFLLGILGNEMFIIDQHASDEKYNFEYLERTTEVIPQRLLRPLQLQFPVADEAIVLRYLAAFKSGGFEIEHRPQNRPTRQLVLHSQPKNGRAFYVQDDLKDIVDRLREGVETGAPLQVSVLRTERERRKLATKACRMSIMIGKNLQQDDMTKVVRNLRDLLHPWTCPHGRPTMRHLTKL